MKENYLYFTKAINKKCVQKILCLLFIFINLQLFAEKPIVISLGGNCAVARALREHEIRTIAYPFDWSVTPFTGLFKIFDEDFKCFLLKENLYLYPHLPAFIVDTYTGCQYNHDFPTINATYVSGLEDEQTMVAEIIVDNFLDYYESIKDKYLRRIERLQAVLNSSQKVVFIRYMITKEEAIALRNLIQAKYPFANFTLIALDSDERHCSPWNEAGIKNYCFPGGYSIENSQSAEWLQVLNENKLLP